MINFTFEGLLLSLLLTVAIYSLPIIIYRYAIKKEPIEKAKAKRITIIYGICAFLVMSALVYAINGRGAAGGAILLWSFVNYHILSREKDVSNEEISLKDSMKSETELYEEAADLAYGDAVHIKPGIPNMNAEVDNNETHNAEARQFIKNTQTETSSGFKIMAIIFSALAVASMIVAAFLAVDNRELSNEISELDSQIAKLTGDITSLQDQNHELATSNSQLYREHESLKGDTAKLRDALSFYKEYACIYTDERGLYHSYGCDALDTSDSFWISNPGALPSRCDPCPNCFPFEYSEDDPSWLEAWTFNRYDFWKN